MAAITSANVAQAIVKLVAADVIPALLGNLVMGNLVNRQYEPVLGQAGDTVNVPIVPAMTANNIAEAGSVSTQNPSLGNAQIVLNTHAEASFQIPDITRVLAVPDLLALYLQPAIIAIAEKIETDLLNLYPTFTELTALGAGATNLTEDTIDQAEGAFFTAKVPAAERRYLVVNQAQYSVLRQIPRFSEFQTAGEAGLTAIIQGTVGQLKGATVLRSQFVPSTSGPVAHNVMFTRNGIGLVIRRLPQPMPGTGAIAEYAELGNFGVRVVMSYAPNTLSQQFTVDVLYGTATLDARRTLELKS